MPKRRNLNGLPYNLTKSFFGTERYYSCGYMADWIVNAARALNISEVTLDILNVTIEPEQFNIRPLIMNLEQLKLIIEKELKGNDFPADFITEAKIKVQLLNPNTHSQTIYCFPILIDREGHKYEPGRIIEDALEGKFDAFDEKNILPRKRRKSLIEKLKSMF